MHAMFSDWYHTIQPMADRATVEKRWDATSECASGITKDQIADLAAYVARGDSGSIEWFRIIYKKYDDVMLTRGIEEELRVLATIALHVSFETDSDLGAMAALALLTAAFGMKDEPSWLDEHLKGAVKRLSAIGAAQREWEGELSVTEATVEQTNNALGIVTRQLQALTESNDCLWWALTDHSRSIGDGYKTVGASVAAMVAPADLIQFVRLLPPSAEAETLLLHVVTAAGGNSDALSLRNYVSGLGRDRAKQLSRDVPRKCTPLCPLTWATLAASEGKSWTAEFEKLYGFKSTATFAPHSIALQTFRELCLAKLFTT
jgi:hypothetical protein